MKLKNLKYPICCLTRHKLTTPSIIDFRDSRNFLIKCDRCGRYVAHSESGLSTTFSEKRAMKLKAEYEEIFDKFGGFEE